MSDFENPNPSGFRKNTFAVDLSKVDCIVRDPRSEGLARIKFHDNSAQHPDEWFGIRITDENFAELLDAFETYHSKR